MRVPLPVSEGDWIPRDIFRPNVGKYSSPMEHMGCFQGVFCWAKKQRGTCVCVCGPVCFLKVAQQSVCVAVWVFFIGVAGMSVRINGVYITEFLLFNPVKKYLGKNSHVQT